MSTPSKIILKIKKEDVGRKIKFDATKLPTPLKEWLERDENGKIWLNQVGDDVTEEITLKGPYIGIYMVIWKVLAQNWLKTIMTMKLH